MSDTTPNERDADPIDLNTLRDQCGALEIALQNEADPARLAELQRELAECRQRVFEVEQREPQEQDRERDTDAPAGAGRVPAGSGQERVVIERDGIEPGDVQPDYAGLYSAERAENAELRQELDAEQGRASGGMERERIDPEITRLAELVEAHKTGVQMSGGIYGGGPEIERIDPQEAGLRELADQHEARVLAHDETFAGEVVQQIDHGHGSAYVVETDGERVMVPSVEGADMDVGDDVEVSRDQQGQYEVETGYGYGR